jgi:hypothetical protein
MKRVLRIIILISILLGTIGLAQGRVAWAQTTADESPAPLQGVAWNVSQHDDDDDDGTVRPPPKRERICKQGTFSIGGVSTIKVTRLDKHYCLIASLRKSNSVRGRIPGGAGQILADITHISIRYRNHFVSYLPTGDGHVEICYAIPPGKTAKIYHLGGHFGVWRQLDTAIKKNVACARVRPAGFYALIGK